MQQHENISIKPLANKIVEKLKSILLLEKFTMEDIGQNFVYRISAGSDVEKILKTGSSRTGFPSKNWINPKSGVVHNFDHSDVLIASTFEDLLSDSLLEEGTLADKLKIYKDPHICVYNQYGHIVPWTLLLTESVAKGQKNHGKHYLIRPNDPLKCLVRIYKIDDLLTKI